MNILSLVAMATFISSQSASALDYYQINAGATGTVSEHGHCRQITNSKSLAIFVPTKSKAELESFIDHLPSLVTTTLCCPTGYVLVPGNGTYGTSNFCVMSYEAKNVGSVATSQAATGPWNNISYYQARRQCQALGRNYDLISNNQWQTIARNLELRASNWAGGVVGTGCIFQGNAGDVDICRYSGSGPPSFDSGTGRNSKAILTLSNGNTITDFSGNVTEYVVGGAKYVSTAWTATDARSLTGAQKTEYGPSGTYSTCGGTDPSDARCGLGWAGYGGPTYAATLRGGDQSDGKSAGIFWVHTSISTIPRTGGNDYVGFRCTYDAATTASTCNGASVGGYCWYLGFTDESCTSVCSQNGGYNAATDTYAGNAGTDANCGAVLSALDAPGSGDSTIHSSNGILGCYTYGSARRRGTGATATAGSTSSVAYRACACNN